MLFTIIPPCVAGPCRDSRWLKPGRPEINFSVYRIHSSIRFGEASPGFDWS